MLVAVVVDVLMPAPILALQQLALQLLLALYSLLAALQ
jgi:hypothetical protein